MFIVPGDVRGRVHMLRWRVGDIHAGGGRRSRSLVKRLVT